MLLGGREDGAETVGSFEGVKLVSPETDSCF